MTRDRAIELFKWGMHYAKPRAKNAAEYREALDYIEAHPDTWKELAWTSSQSTPAT